jgi:cation transport ATPase
VLGEVSDCPASPAHIAIGSGTDVAGKVGHLVLFGNDLRSVF